jgi:hypothetical protein
MQITGYLTYIKVPHLETLDNFTPIDLISWKLLKK